MIYGQTVWPTTAIAFKDLSRIITNTNRHTRKQLPKYSCEMLVKLNNKELLIAFQRPVVYPSLSFSRCVRIRVFIPPGRREWRGVTLRTLTASNRCSAEIMKSIYHMRNHHAVLVVNHSCRAPQDVDSSPFLHFTVSVTALKCSLDPTAGGATSVLVKKEFKS